MEAITLDLIEKAFHPLRVSFGQRRPDGGTVLTLADEADVTAYSRVISSAEQNDPLLFGTVVEDVRRELSVRSGTLSAEMRKVLKEQDGILPYIPV
ncbi:MAG: DUF3509 domain-containing protein [Pseudomonadota bacterium]